MLGCLVYCRKTAPAMSMTHLVALLYIAENPGLAVSQLAELLGSTLATASRTARALAPHDMPGSLPPALGYARMMTRASQPNHRYLYLTDTGYELCSSLDEKLSRTLLIAAPSRSHQLGF